jgi:ATP-dependent RNA helicase DDX56/DBP9
VSTDADEKIWSKIIEKQARNRGLASAEGVVKEYRFDQKQIQAFKYRMEDALRSVTRKAVKEARVKELKNEVLNSTKLKVTSLTLLLICTTLIQNR